MLKEQKNSRPAGTGTAENAKPEKILRKHYTTNRAKNQALFAFLVCCIILMVSVLAFSCDKTGLVPARHKVTYGETLWSIAKQYKPDEMTMDEYMSFVYKHNKGGIIYPGDIVIVGVTEND